MERRASHRATARQDILARVSDSPVELTLLDVSVSGCKARSKAGAFAAGSRIALPLSPTETVRGDIVWCDSGLIGIRFARNLTLESLMRLVRNGLAESRGEWFVRDTFGRALPEPGSKRLMRAKPSDNRLDPRHALKCRAELRMGYERDPKATIYNLSTGGCLIRHGFDLLAVEDRVNVTLPDFESFSGLVRWKKGNRAGIRFDRTLHPAVVELIIRRQRAGQDFAAQETAMRAAANAAKAPV